MKLTYLKEKIDKCLNNLYTKDEILFRRNFGKGVCERCIAFRFAYYLQKRFNRYCVDCDFNSSSEMGQERQGKPILNPRGIEVKRFIDIIIHKRTFDFQNDFICFEIKKWNNYDKESEKKDKNNLKVLTSQYGYLFGFYIILGKTQEETKIIVFKNGREI